MLCKYIIPKHPSLSFVHGSSVGDFEPVYCEFIISQSFGEFDSPFFLPAMICRLEKHGAPAPHFYRKMARGILSEKTKAHRALAAHHQAWENFLFEQLLGVKAG